MSGLPDLCFLARLVLGEGLAAVVAGEVLGVPGLVQGLDAVLKRPGRKSDVTLLVKEIWFRVYGA